MASGFGVSLLMLGFISTASAQVPVPLSERLREAPPPQIVEPPRILPASVRRVRKVRKSRPLAQVSLAAQLDRHLTPPELLRDLNGRPHFISAALDRGTKPFVAFTAAETRVVPAGSLHRQPVDVTLAPDTRYRVSLEINVFDPLGSKIQVRPSPGYKGASYTVKARELQALLRKYGVNLALGKPHIFLYGRDADRATGTLLTTRSFYFVLDDGLDSKGWVLGEEQIPQGKWAEVELGAEKLLMRRSGDDVEFRAP